MSLPSHPDLPLAGLRVLALEHAVAAPIATRQLADMGAEVIKLERPGAGDFARGYDGAVRGMSSFFIWLNRGKRSVTLDVKAPGAAGILARLVGSVDVVVQNWAPGATARLGLSWEALSARHPGLILCDISGYGEGGPYANRKAYDLLIQAEAGLMSVTGTAEIPARAGISAADIATGMYVSSGILSALVRRGRSGQGAHLQVAMLDAMAEWLGNSLYHAAYGAGPPERRASSHPSLAPYGVHHAGDGQVIFGIQNDREWPGFCRIVLGKPDLAADPRFATNIARVQNREAMTAIIEREFAALGSAEVTARLERAGIANGRMNDAREVWNHPQLAARDRWREVATPVGAVRAMLPPVTFGDVEAAMGEVPALGAHTDAVLAGLGFTSAEIEAFRAAGAI
ncbi:CaiB/BaiF CoA transferase family protein [Roseococcus sp. YIM B11640]|uniref:CaiB/BaiF CoA transferase family protein n=1 Tax=Roseococcus sp. YIM B11640 TaxID=3133973 RepID=UPI003C7A5AF7